MPRVHGIDIVPRRGRGPRRQRVPMVADGVDVIADMLVVTESNAGASSQHHDNSDDIHDNVRTSLDVAVNGSAGHGGEGNYCIASPTKSPHGSNISGKVNDETMPAVAVEADTTLNVNVVSSASTKGIVTATSCIRPQPRESLDFINFGSRSFSVQQTSHMSPPTCNLNNVRLDSLRPSLESTTELNYISAQNEMFTETKIHVANETASIEDMGKINCVEESLNSIQHLSEKSHIVQGITFTDANVSLNQNETTEEAQQNTNQYMAPTITDGTPIDAGDSLNESNNTHWLFHRCSAACLQMETQMSPLELAIKTLHAIRCVTDDDRFEENLQHILFAVLKNGKRRDLEFVFEVSERATELRDDTTLTDASLRKAASTATRNDITNEEHNTKSDDDEIYAHLDIARQSIERLTVQLEQNEGLSTAHSTPSGQSHTNGMHLSRRKKCQSNANGVILQGGHTSFTSIREKTSNREITDGFVTNVDGLDLQDDEMWSFLPNTQLIDEMDEDEEPPTQRITRSMILENNVATEYAQSCLEICAEEDVAEDTETQVLGLNAKVSEVRIDCSSKDHVDWERGGTNEILPQSETTRVHRMASRNEDGEVYSMVKIRERSEGKGSVRIVFTCLTPTHRHMQMIETIGAEYVNSIEEAHTATHVIASDGITKLRRTPKLMICICRVAQILSIEWLEQSAKQQCILDTNEFLLLDDREAERRYNFSMKTTIRNGILARKRRGGVLGGWSVYICSGVAGNKAPSLREIHLIIEAGGGQVMKSLSSTESSDRTKTIVLTSDPSTKLQLGELGVAKAKSCGAKVMSTSSLFHTIITQNLFDVDINYDAVDETMDPAPSRVNDIVMCASPASMASSISVKSKTPVKRGRLPTNTPVREASIEFNDNESVRTRGCRVSHLEHARHEATPYPKKRKLNYKVYEQATSQMCTSSITRNSYQLILTSIKALSAGRDQAANFTSFLWREYFTEASKTSSPAAAKILLNRSRKGVRCLRGRNRSISPLVSCTNSGRPINAKICVRPKSVFNQLLEDNVFVTWESYVLFTLGDRAKTLMLNIPETLDEIIPASNFFPHPIAIAQDRCTKQVKEVDSAQTVSPHRGLSLDLAAHGSDTERSSFKIFGTLQDLFSLHRQHQTSGMIPEQVIAMLSLQAIEAVAAMHSCNVVHNEIGLDAFLLVKKVKSFPHNWVQSKCEKVIDSWYLQLIGFGHNAVVLNCQDNGQEERFARDYQCLANVIHLLITGGVEISLTSVNGMIDFTSKPFIKGNMFLRGALSWCSLFQALMCVEGRVSTCKTSEIFRLHYPVNFPHITRSNDERMGRFAWSFRVLQELRDRRVLNDFIDGLCTYNSRFNHPSNVSTYRIGSGIVRQSFTCYTSSEQTADHLMELESRLHSDHTAMAQRETAFKEEIAKFEKLKLEQNAVLTRESDVQKRETDLLRREREHALEIKELDTLKQKIRLMESRIEQKLQLLETSSSTLSSHSIHQQEHIDIDTTRICEPYSKLPLTSQLHATHKSATKSILDQPMRSLSGHLHKNRIHFTTEDAFLSPHTSQHKPKMDHNHKPPSLDSSNGAIGSQESTSNSRQKKKGSARKSPKCSLHFLPRSPQKTPKKVFIDLGEE